MSYYLFLDDTRQPEDVSWMKLPKKEWIVVESFTKFKETILARGLPKLIYFDHDLEQGHYDEYFRCVEQNDTNIDYARVKNTGWHCAEWLVDYCIKKNLKIPAFEVHSQNQIGVSTIKSLLCKNKDLLDKHPSLEDSIFMHQEVPAYVEHTDLLISGFFGDYRFLSNFYPCWVEYMGIDFPSTEAAYQAAKCQTKEERLKFSLLNPREAKRLGRVVTIKENWDVMKYHVMSYLVFQKFSKHKDLREALLKTGVVPLVEANNWRDKIWGVHCSLDNGVWVKEGKNLLGSILMDARAALS